MAVNRAEVATALVAVLILVALVTFGMLRPLRNEEPSPRWECCPSPARMDPAPRR